MIELLSIIFLGTAVIFNCLTIRRLERKIAVLEYENSKMSENFTKNM